MMKNKEYIQLPALHRDISEEELLCIWEFAKLPDEAQEQMLDRVKEALREDVVQKDIADLLGHSSINVTRIYTATTETVFQKKLDKIVEQEILECTT